MDANELSSDSTQMESLRESGRRQIVQTLPGVLPVIKYPDVFGDFFLGLTAGYEFAMKDEFIFQ